MLEIAGSIIAKSLWRSGGYEIEVSYLRRTDGEQDENIEPMQVGFDKRVNCNLMF